MQAIGIVIVVGPEPAKLNAPSTQLPVPAETEVLAADGVVHPAGTTTVTAEPVTYELAGAVNVKTN